MTTEEVKYLKKLRDHKFYLENLCQIKTKTKGFQPFILKQAQIDLFNEMRKCTRIMLLKCRQLGMSTAVAGFLYVDTIMRPGITSALVGYNSDMVVELFDKIKTFHSTTPKELRPTIYLDSKNEMSFPAMGSKIIVLPCTKNVGRSYTLQNVLVTELAMWDDAETKMNGLSESVPHGERIIIESTPNGIGDLYHRMWMQENEYVKKQYDWWWGYTEKEMIAKRKEKGDLLFDQEYNCKFLSSGRNVFDVNMLEKHRTNILKVGDINKAREKGQEDFKVKEEDGWVIYREPKEKGIYVVGGDTSEGVKGGDPSIAVIFDRATGEEVAMFRGFRPPDVFGEMLNKMGRRYKDALMVVEVNNHGLVTSMTLKKLIYPNLYFRPSKYETIGTGTTDRLGWRTTPITRPILINELASAIRNSEITIHSKNTLDEMLTFVYNDNGDMKPSSRGLHDDAIFAAGIALQGFKNIATIKPIQLDYEQILPQNFAY